MSLLSKTEIQKGISDLDGWEYVDGSIKKTFSFDTYMDSISSVSYTHLTLPTILRV